MQEHQHIVSYKHTPIPMRSQPEEKRRKFVFRLIDESVGNYNQQSLVHYSTAASRYRDKLP